ncbi:hypothetical protein SJI19_18820 [Acerihabitans sp. TG2]|uniref:hypothetical protein n=1 Tax=Acerihabitans sp. TG2 TaxID=3096008 RepID=UPI002B22B326|nr:hypothetical protein [Acerihabitans sp. TG2]MEA9392567.1 hypothetical protein [Acerihabitans sp. TG2]
MKQSRSSDNPITAISMQAMAGPQVCGFCRQHGFFNTIDGFYKCHSHFGDMNTLMASISVTRALAI